MFEVKIADVKAPALQRNGNAPAINVEPPADFFGFTVS